MFSGRTKPHLFAEARTLSLSKERVGACVRVRLFHSAQIAALLTLCPAILHAAPAALPVAVPMTLTVVAGQGTVQDGPAAAHFDFGTRSRLDNSPLVHIFVLRNEGKSPLTIDRLQSSCGCTTAAAGNVNALPLTLVPGQSVPIRIEVAPRRLLPGDTHKSVWVYAHGDGDTVTLLEMRGVVLENTPPATPPHTQDVPQDVDNKASTLVPAQSPKTGLPAPLLAGTDSQGRKFTLSAQRGHPVALLFFCGCPECAAAADAWAQKQRSGTLPAGTRTVVVFDGDPAAAKAFAATHSLVSEKTTVLPDPDSALTEGIYKISSCPRVFAVDASGTIRYTNDHWDDQPRRVPARSLIGRLQSFLSRRQTAAPHELGSKESEQ